MSARLPAGTTWSCCARRTTAATSTAITTPPRKSTRTLKRPVVKALNALAKFRNELDAFDGTFSYTTDDDTSISFTWRGETSQATLTFEPKRGLGVDNTTPVAMLEWEDSCGRPPFGSI